MDDRTLSLKPLQMNLHRLDAKDQNFARSMLDQLERRGLSDNQWNWIKKLADRACGTETVPTKVEVGSLAGIQSLFATARKHLKRPAIVLQVAGAGEVRFAEAGNNARVPGSINVATNAPFGQSTWFGRITLDGVFTASQEATPDGLVDAMRAFATDPVKVASEHGRLTGKCCFCNQGLKDERSTAVGYGPVCASNFGLPWGTKAARAA